MSSSRQETSRGTAGEGSSKAGGGLLKLGPVETSILDYVLVVHGSEATSRAAFIALLVHAGLLARGARLLEESGEITPALLKTGWSSKDPIRNSYTLVTRPKSGTLASPSCHLQLSVTETDSNIFVSLTDSTTDKFGHLDLSGMEHVRLDTDSLHRSLDANTIFPQLQSLLDSIEDKLWKPVLPSPPVARVSEIERKRERQEDRSPMPDDFVAHPQRVFQSFVDGRPSTPRTPVFGYGRSDIGAPEGPLGLNIPSQPGGMLFDPRSGIGINPMLGGPGALPRGAVPPGARFDPFGPGVGRPRRSGPDPDHDLPPGFEDMYL